MRETTRKESCKWNARKKHPGPNTEEKRLEHSGWLIERELPHCGMNCGSQPTGDRRCKDTTEESSDNEKNACDTDILGFHFSVCEQRLTYD